MRLNTVRDGWWIWWDYFDTRSMKDFSTMAQLSYHRYCIACGGVIKIETQSQQHQIADNIQEDPHRRGLYTNKLLYLILRIITTPVHENICFFWSLFSHYHTSINTLPYRLNIIITIYSSLTSSPTNPFPFKDPQTGTTTITN